MRTMSACCLRVSLKLSEEGMDGGECSRFIVRLGGRERKSAVVKCLWERCGIRRQSVERYVKASQAPGQLASGSTARRIISTSSFMRVDERMRRWRSINLLL